MALRHISDSIRAGDINIGIAVGYESMSSQYVLTDIISSGLSF